MQFFIIHFLFLFTACSQTGEDEDIIRKHGFIYEVIFKEGDEWKNTYLFSEEFKCNFNIEFEDGFWYFRDQDQMVVFWHSIPLDHKLHFKKYDYDYDNFIKNTPNRCYELEDYDENPNLKIFIGQTRLDLLPLEKIEKYTDLEKDVFGNEKALKDRFGESAKFFMILNFHSVE